MPEPQDRSTFTRAESITPEAFARLRAIFEAALDRPHSERSAFVAAACADNLDLLRNVQAMLAAASNDDPLLQDPLSSSVPNEGRFTAGDVLAARYRIVGVIGKGGMGEIYRADDLILNQSVALKFVSATAVSDAALARFRNEVRIARRVSHPNVCRVYDIGVADGLYFLSMEYIDGEDLASLIRRIGRLPQDKAIEFSRKICAALGAAHDLGVLHRDLKPANIMIDGRGQVRITDFGLAAIAAEIPSTDVRSGTPAYMSPEQKAGSEVTPRSDIYSLGLVVYEMFTGKARGETESSPSELVQGIDPAIDSLILQCLDKDPKRRPSSALAFAMSLPGADPITAALAAGETPSPEMIAASPEKARINPKTAVVCFSCTVLSLLIGLWVSETQSFFARAGLPIPPDALADRAQQFVKAIGYVEEPGSKDHAFVCCDQKAIENLYLYPPARRTEILASHRPAIRYFEYHQHHTIGRTMHALGPGVLDPSEPGMITTRLDAKGRLVKLEVQPIWRPTVVAPVDWATLFSTAGLDLTRFTSIPPRSIPPMSSDTRLAWTGSYSEQRNERVRIEAASWQGLPVFFSVEPFTNPTEGNLTAVSVPGVGLLLIMTLSLIVSAITAWRNTRQGRTDRRGAAVIAGSVFALGFGGWISQAGHIHSAYEANMFARAFSWPTFLAVSFWLFYVALEPYVRRNWPDALVSWTRLCNRKFQDPVVASHILVGIVAAEAFALIVRPGFTAVSGGFSVLQVGHVAFASLLDLSIIMFAFAMAFTLVAALIRRSIRKHWVADLIVAGIFAPPAGLAYYGTSTTWLIALLCLFASACFLWMWMLRRFGFLTNLMIWMVQAIAAAWPLTITGWFASRSIVVHLLPVAIAAWATWVLVHSRKLHPTISVS